MTRRGSFLLVLVLAWAAGLGSGCAGRAGRDPMPVFAPGTRVLFQGDSITDGNRGRNADPNHILGHGYQALVASRFDADLAGRGLVFLNRGVSGNTVSDLARRWPQDTLALQPDLLSILIGINDLNAGVPAAEYEARYDALLASTRAALPRVWLVLGEPFGLPVGGKKAGWERFAADLAERRAIVHRLAARHGATVVPYQAAFDAATRRAPAEHWIWDGIHPTYAGHQLMADAWVAAVRGMRMPR